MAFKSVKDYNREKYGGLFILPNDGDTADVIFLYQGEEDALIADVHYIKSDDYSGYVHCTGRGCPACEKGIRTQTKLFIPLYNITAGEVQFWDRSRRFESQLQQDVFSKFPNPSEFVFRIVRNGAAGDVNTTYRITAVGRNTLKSFAEVCSEQHISFPEYYETICKDCPPSEMRAMLNNSAPAGGGYSAGSGLPNYQVTPRSNVGMAPPPMPANPISEPPATLDGDEFPDDVPFDFPDGEGSAEGLDDDGEVQF